MHSNSWQPLNGSLFPAGALNQRCYAILLTGLLHGIGLATVAHAEAPFQNVLVLYADDWRHDTLGAAGNPVVKTPHLDQLAGEGLRCTHHGVTTSICGVSRVSLLTGQWMSRHGCRAFSKFDAPFDETYPGLLRQAGFHVRHVGKWHNGAFSAKSEVAAKLDKYIATIESSTDTPDLVSLEDFRTSTPRKK